METDLECDLSDVDITRKVLYSLRIVNSFQISCLGISILNSTVISLINEAIVGSRKKMMRPCPHFLKARYVAFCVLVSPTCASVISE